jgi:predicted enzyme related to lactoylglutathione lyase
MTEGGFVWYELITKDPGAAATFYAEVVGWSIEVFPMPEFDYRLAKVGDRRIVGIMPPPADRPAEAPDMWYGYVGVDDVDAKAAAVVANGGTMLKPAFDIPQVGRMAVVADPHGAPFMLFRAEGEAPAALSYMTPGSIGWHELSAGADWQAVYPFYETLFGWEKGDAIDMGPMGTYQLLRIAGEDVGAMMSDPQNRPQWRFYFAVDDIDAAATRVTAHGGAIVMGPMEVPGGLFVILAGDPLGTPFALVGRRPG